MGLVRRHQRVFAALAVLALVTNLVASAFCHVPARATLLVDDVLGVLTICATDSSGNVQHDGAPNPAGRTEGGCTSCTLLKVFAFAIALAFAAIAFPIRIITPPVPRGVRTLAQHLRLGAIRSRAPPIPA
jgi:hypothetical protein